LYKESLASSYEKSEKLEKNEETIMKQSLLIKKLTSEKEEKEK
jgi:hypothetical protein